MQQNVMFEDDAQVDELVPGTRLLHGQYVVERNLVRGGFGITYLARDSLDRTVVIKECFPGGICVRAGGQVQPRSGAQDKQYASIVRHFLREARRLARLNHRRIVGVHQVFEENNTAYMALDFVDGVDLMTILEDEPETLHPALVVDLLGKVLQAVRYIHDEGILHRDISPDNILVDGDGEVTLIDFGAAREQATKENRALSALLAVKDGYSPYEFYLTDVTQCPSSDLYSIGATFHHLITGEAPPNSQDRLAAIAADGDDLYRPLAGSVAGYDARFLQAIDTALSVLPKDRIQTAADWLTEIEGLGAVAAPAQVAVADTEQPADPVSEPTSAELQDKILQLVADTNRDLDPGKPAEPAGKTPRSRRGSAPAPVFEDGPAKPAQRVDIFGNRIDDVDAWLKEQDRQMRREARAIAERELKKNKAGADRKPRQSYLARLFRPRTSSGDSDMNQALQH